MNMLLFVCNVHSALTVCYFPLTFKFSYVYALFLNKVLKPLKVMTLSHILCILEVQSIVFIELSGHFSLLSSERLSLCISRPRHFKEKAQLFEECPSIWVCAMFPHCWIHSMDLGQEYLRGAKGI